MKTNLYFLMICMFFLSFSLAAAAQELPANWTSVDIGEHESPGSASYNSETGVLTIIGSGLNFWATDDAHFAYVMIEGDFEFQARIVTFEGALGGAAKSGINVRNSLNPDASSILMAWENWGGLATTARKGSGITPTWKGGTYPGAGAIPWYLKVKRSGETFFTFESFDNTTWVRVDTLEYPAMQSTAFVGLAISPNNATLATATYDSIQITGNVITSLGEVFLPNTKHTVFPNPANNEIYIDIINDESVASIAIYDIRGTKMLNVENGLKNNQIDISGLKPGVYFLHVVTKMGASSTKFIRQ